MAYVDVDKFAEAICDFQAIDDIATDEVIWFLRTFPTADVAPKSEFEELISENESLAKTVNEASELIRKLRSKVEKSKTEVAREIFEEIDKIRLMEKCFQRVNVFYDTAGEYEKIKKKYTEDEG